MLVLSRKQGESIEFPELNVVIRVMQLKKSKVQLGIEAPRSIKVDRSEMVSKTQAGNSSASATSSSSSSSRSGSDACKCDSGLSETACLGDFPQRMVDDLLKLEAEVAAMAELVAAKDRELARQVAAISIERLVSLRRTIRVAERNGQARPIAEFMKARGKLLEHDLDRSGTPSKPKHWEEVSHANGQSVRQPRSGYLVEPAMESACHVA